jgi:hypothetical protein
MRFEVAVKGTAKCWVGRNDDEMTGETAGQI